MKIISFCISTIRRLISPSYWILFSSRNHLNIIKTIWVNFHFLPFEQAIKLPIFIYGRLKFLRITPNGISIDCKVVSRGMVKINIWNTSSCASGGGTEIVLQTNGKIIFEGSARIGIGCRINVNNGGVLRIGPNFIMNNQNNIGCFNSIYIAEDVIVGHQNQIFDTNFHHIMETNTKRVLRSNNEIVIGRKTWIGNRVTILQGSIIPPNSILASNTLISKPFSESNTIIGGIPGKVIKSNVEMIRNLALEGYLHPYFSEKKERMYYEINNKTD